MKENIRGDLCAAAEKHQCVFIIIIKLLFLE